MRFATLAALLLMTLLFAGCAGGGGSKDGPSTPSSVVEASGDVLPDAGTLRVLVVDDAVTPLAGADVAIVDLSLSATTNDQGEAIFTNLAPGKYKVAAQKLGYSSFARSEEIVANEERSITITLEALAIAEPYSEILGPYQGYFDCRLGIAIQTGACVPLAAANANDKANFDFEMHETTIAWVGEMTWGQGSFATSQQLRLSFSHDKRDSTHWFCTSTSGSPVRWTYILEEGCQAKAYCGIASSQGTGGSQPAEPTTKLKLRAYVNTPFSCPNAGAPTPDTGNLHPVELAIQQKFQIWVTQFQDMLPAEGYSALPDQ